MIVKTLTHRRYLLIGLLFVAGCGHGTLQMKSADSDSSCTRTHWWIEAPETMAVGDEATIVIGRCQGWATPASFTWSTSDAMVLGIVVADSDRVVVKALKRGTATLTARSAQPRARSDVHIKVVM
jgi:hypothetical protein